MFLGLEPHPMNANFDLTYVSGGDEVFGDLGGATVYTTCAPAISRSARTSVSC